MATEKFPKARIAFGAGDLNKAIDVTLTRNRNVKNIATMRKRNAGQSSGAKDDSLEFTLVVGEDGLERDFDGAYDREETVNLRLKIPGGLTYPFDGQFDNPVISSQVDGATTYKCKVVGDCGEPS